MSQPQDPRNLLPDGPFRNLPATQNNSRAVAYPEASRYGPAEEFQLKGVWRLFRKHKWLILGIVLIVTTMITIDVYRTRPTYEASSTIEIGREGGTRVSSNEVFIQDEDDLYVTMNTSEVILKSAPLLEDVVVQLQLDRNAAFTAGNERKSVWESINDIAGKIGEDAAPASPAVFTSTPVKTKISGTRTAEETERLAPYVGIIAGGLKIRSIPDTRVMTIAYTHTDPAIAASVANAVAQRFVETSFDKRIQKFTSASEWLDRSTRELKAKVEHSEEALSAYTRANNIYATEGNETLVTGKLTRLFDQVSRAETDRILKESLYQQVVQGHVDQIPESFADPATRDLRGKLGQLSVTAAELSATYGPKYWKLAEVQQQMTELRQQLASSRDTLEAKLKADYERAVADEEALADALDIAKSEAGRRTSA